MSKKLLGKAHAAGFTLIELMIVVAIMAVLVSIAFPAYNNQMIKSRRTDAERAMVEYGQALERYFTANGKYASSGTTCGATLPSNSSYYNFSCAVDATSGVATITATAQTGSQLGDGNLTLDSQGVKTPADKWKY